jgi:AraC-like DNA-binding protein
VSAGSVFVTWPGHALEYGPDGGTTWDEYFVRIEGEGVTKWQECGWLPPVGVIWQLPPGLKIATRLRACMRLLRRGHMGDPDRVMIRLEELMLDIRVGQSESFAGLRKRSRLDDILAACSHRLSERIDFRAVAAEYGVSYSWLRQSVRRTTGLSPDRHLARQRCQMARQLLLSTDLPVKQIAAGVGIPGAVNFSRTFRRVMGCSASSLRHG